MKLVKGKRAIDVTVVEADCVCIPSNAIRACGGNYHLAAVISYLAELSLTLSDQDGWFYQKRKDIAQALVLSEHQVQRLVTAFKSKFPSAIRTKRKKVEGVPTVHFHIDVAELEKEMERILDERNW